VGVISGRSATSRPPLAVKLKSCAFDLVAGLRLVEIERPPARRIVFRKAKTPSRLPPRDGKIEVTGAQNSSG